MTSHRFLSARVPELVPIGPGDVPNFLVLEPRGGVRLDVRLPTPACVIDASHQSPLPGRSFILMVGQPSEPFVQRARIAGRAKLHFEPGTPGLYVILLTNPMREPAAVRLRLRPIVVEARSKRPGRGSKARGRSSESTDRRRLVY